MTPTSQYCYKSWACDSDVISDVVGSASEDDESESSSEREQVRAAAVVGRERCFDELGGHSWGLYGGTCEKRSDDHQQQREQFVPDTLHGLYPP